jgi:serine/threonine protein kinase
VTARSIQLEYLWTLGDRLDGGGFGSVFIANSPEIEVPAVAKLVPKVPGAERELLFVDLGGARNVMPVLDSGEDGDDYVLVMERAEKSLKQHLDEHGKLSEQETVTVLLDIVAALEDLAGRVVHRDLKPGNVLLLTGHWCLADFGISRYADASTAEDTRKFSKTRQYAAPEQWREERATTATDIYALGIMAYQMLAGTRPFAGPDYRHQHLHDTPATLQNVSAPMASLVNECLLKHPGSRPSPGDVARRLAALSGPPVRPGLAGLQDAHHSEVGRRAEVFSEMSRAETAQERNHRLFQDAERSLTLIGDELRNALLDAAPTIGSGQGRGDLWTLSFGRAFLRLSEPRGYQADAQTPLPFEVTAFAALSLEAPGSHGYRGRTHSLWYCDAMDADLFNWYELAFMSSAFSGPPGPVIPFALSPDQGALAVAPGVQMVRVAFNFRRLVPGELGDFIDRWGSWFARAYRGDWQMPNQMPEEQILKNWRGATRA